MFSAAGSGHGLSGFVKSLFEELSAPLRLVFVLLGT
jgi:hypothetical protein